MMTSISRSLLLSAALMAAPLAGAIAQQNNPAGNYGSNRSATAAPGTADSKPMSGMNTGDAGPGDANSAAARSGSGMTPGNAGRTLVAPPNSNRADTAAMPPSQGGNRSRQ
jgi:hypothetical protein